jgi:hypothetical protein
VHRLAGELLDDPDGAEVIAPGLAGVEKAHRRGEKEDPGQHAGDGHRAAVHPGETRGHGAAEKAELDQGIDAVQALAGLALARPAQVAAELAEPGERASPAPGVKTGEGEAERQEGQPPGPYRCRPVHAGENPSRISSTSMACEP